MTKRAKKSKGAAKTKTDAAISGAELDRQFDDGEDVTEHLDLERATKFVNVEFPLWMVKALDDEAQRLGIPRQAVIKMWLDEKLQRVSRERTAVG